MNSDKIERLRRARATTAPEVSRSAQTPPPRPTFVLRHRRKRRKDETLRTNEMSFWRLYDVLSNASGLRERQTADFFFVSFSSILAGFGSGRL